MLPEPETAGASRSPLESIASTRSVTGPSGQHLTVPEGPTTTKTTRLPLWQKMENKVAISRVKKAKERLQYKKQMVKGSNEEVDGDEVRDEGFVEQEYLTESNPMFAQIWKLREELGAYTTTYGACDSQPPHPNHHQTWFSKNLRCTVCTENCGICGVACCKWNEAKVAEREAYLASETMMAATRIIQRIEVYLLTGFDLPTFLRCTECRTFVCPSCCGQCPVTMCKGLRCNKCVEDPWQRCEWHDESDK
ncbi:MAG: hypothetical protein M1839_008437 [Geoglossum umbratile]|nr:MAG: hypothetical protein M1839_008437 [Geoglossum umbratile]